MRQTFYKIILRASYNKGIANRFVMIEGITDFRFQDFEYLGLLLLIIGTVPVLNFSIFKKKKALNAFFSDAELAKKFISLKKELIKFLVFSFSLVLLILALMRPQANPTQIEVENKGRDLIFILDVSKSMLAQDLIPSRLEKAKELILDILSTLKGDRVGLLIFAGNTAIKCPLTLDYFYFENVLRSVSVNDLSKGGTNIGDAIRTVTNQLFVDFDKQYRDIILITDGEDQDSFPVEAAKESGEKGIKIHTIGIGDENGVEIPIPQSGSGVVRYQKQVVKTKLDEETLREIARVTEGTYIPLKTKLANMGEIYQTYIAVDKTRSFKTKGVKIWEEFFQYFIFVPILLVGSSIIFQRK